MSVKAKDDPRHEMALLYRMLIGSAVFFALLLIGVQFARAAESIPPACMAPATASVEFGAGA